MSAPRYRYWNMKGPFGEGWHWFDNHTGQGCGPFATQEACKKDCIEKAEKKP